MPWEPTLPLSQLHPVSSPPPQLNWTGWWRWETPGALPAPRAERGTRGCQDARAPSQGSARFLRPSQHAAASASRSPGLPSPPASLSALITPPTRVATRPVTHGPASALTRPEHPDASRGARGSGPGHPNTLGPPFPSILPIFTRFSPVWSTSGQFCLIFARFCLI